MTRTHLEQVLSTGDAVMSRAEGADIVMKTRDRDRGKESMHHI